MKKLYLIMFVFSVSSLLVAQEKGNAKSTAAVKSKVAKNIDAPQGAIKNNSTAAVAVYDFTTGAGQYYGGAAAAKEVEPGVWAMIAGDANSDGTVNAIDFNGHWLPQNGTAYNYSKTGDFNLDGTINAVDYNNYWLLNNGKATQVPN